MRKIYNYVLHLSSKRYAVWILAFVAFAESSVFPIPPDIILIPMILAAREKAWRLAAVCTIMSVLGGFLGYTFGAFLFETVGQKVIYLYGLESAFTRFSDRYNEMGAWIVAFFGVTPFPYKVITIASGATHLDPITFGVASTLSRGVRFFLLAGLLWLFGPIVRKFIERYLGWLIITICIILCLSYISLKFYL